MLPNGQYIITNVGLDQMAGQSPTPPTPKPIVGTDRFQVWNVSHIRDDRYFLTIHLFITRSNNNLVWSYLPPDIIGTQWILEPTLEGDDTYSIIDSDILPGRPAHLWTLREEDTQVALELREGPEPGPNQIWRFQFFVGP
ncbi:hypothetical protein F5148DRAFT_1148437 [Russula earlei]|uniref:Uncharacterized protein n=1 Tax=Russula earlei TaxID=71964 RepID=A0ACC0UCB6_9AGAM|nr:hypothetical protein F5148DRAFT_1148437 [Russula earlei]